MLVLAVIFLVSFGAAHGFKIMPSLNLTTNVIPTTHVPKQQQPGTYKEPPLAYTSTEEKLLEYLFRDYNPNIIPRENSNESLKLYIGLAMVQLINIVRLKA